MDILKTFMSHIQGTFDNHEQLQNESNVKLPQASHVNTIMNSRIRNLPSDFKGYFLLEESYYKQDSTTNSQPHLFLYTLQDTGKVCLTSYDVPKRFTRDMQRYDNVDFTFDYEELTPSSKFTPVLFEEEQGVFIGGSESMFTPVMKFTLHLEIGADTLIVSESMAVNGRKTFGFERPIIYRRLEN